MNITFRQLKIFEAVARQVSFTRAAAELHLTQPAVSMQIKQLEQEAGVPLLEQVGKRIHLTCTSMWVTTPSTIRRDLRHFRW